MTEDFQPNLALFNNAAPEYERYYFDEETGGFVLIHVDHNTSESDRVVAQALARRGLIVKLLSERAPEGVPTPDASVNDQLYEFKELTPRSQNLRNRVQEEISTARKQGAVGVVFHLNRTDYKIESVNRGIRQAFFWDKQQKIQVIWLLEPTGNLTSITREEWESGQRF